MQHRDSFLIITALVLVSLLAWVVTVREMGSMGVGMMTHSMTMGQPFSLSNAGLYIVFWGVMMVAMMFPSVAPMVVLFSTIARRKQEQNEQEEQEAQTSSSRSSSSVWIFVAGYTLLWTLTGGVAYAGDLAMQSLPHAFPSLRTYGSVIGGATLVIAGLYQLTPLKYLCLTQCRSPFGFLVQHWQEGARGAFRMGFHHGAYCLGCCWSLMAVMFVMGTMNLVWMGILSLVIFVEKIVPHGLNMGKAVGVGLIGIGLLMAVYPSVFNIQM
jgi:predicted metal-binding membrane protein